MNYLDKLYKKYKLISKDSEKVTEEMIYNVISKATTFDEAALYWQFNYFNKKSVWGRKIIKILINLAEKKVTNYSSFRTAYFDMTKLPGFYSSSGGINEIEEIFRKKIIEIAKKQIKKSRIKKDLLTLSKLANDAEVTKDVYYNFDVQFRNALYDITTELIESANQDVNKLLNLYSEAQATKCAITINLIAIEITNQLLKKQSQT